MPRRANSGSAVPACPRGHTSRVVRAGTYGPPDRPRQLWWCRPVDGTKPHRFAERLPRRVLEPGPHTCDTCETHLAVFEGPQHPRQYEFAARMVAQALVAVGSGVTYRRAAATARTASAKELRRGTKYGPNGTLAGDWVAAFAPVVTGPVFDGEEWPEMVALDELPFGTTISKRRKQRTQWVIFGAYAHPTRTGGGGHLFRLKASPNLNAAAAAAWLTSIPGRPKYVVADGSKMWPKAVRLAWPPVVDPATGEVLADIPRLVPCQYHLKARLIQALRATGVQPPRDAPDLGLKPPRPIKRPTTGPLANLRVRAAEPDWYAQHRVALRSYPDPDQHPLSVAAGRAFYTVERWDELHALAHTWQAGHLLGFLNREQWIRDAIANHPAGVPKSIGGLEAQLHIVRREVGWRSKVFRNVVRTQRMLDLMTLHLRHVDQVDTYARHIRTHLEAHHRAAPPQREGVTGGAQLH